MIKAKQMEHSRPEVIDFARAFNRVVAEPVYSAVGRPGATATRGVVAALLYGDLKRPRKHRAERQRTWPIHRHGRRQERRAD